MGKTAIPVPFVELKQDFFRRTAEGLAAAERLGQRIADTVRTEPERVVYLGAGVVNVTSSLFGWEKPRKITKVTLMPALACNVLNRRREASTSTVVTLVAGLAGGWIGDLILAPKVPDLNRGSAAFAVNQLAYIVLLRQSGASFNTFRTVARYPLWALSSLGALLQNPALAPAALGYGPILTAMSTLADDSELVRGVERGDAAYLLGHGGNLFLLSDALLMAKKLIGDTGRLGQILDAGVMDTYITAQWFIVEGLMARDRAGSR